MKKFFTILFMPLLLTNCDNFGTTKIKSLIDLTPKLEIESPRDHLFSTGIQNPFRGNSSSYTIAKSRIISQPAIVKGMIYSIDNNGYVTAFSLKTKKIIWTKDIDGPQSEKLFDAGGILYSDERLYITYGTRILVVLDAINGREIVRKEFPDVLRGKPIIINNNLIIVQTLSNQLIAYDIKTLKTKWTNDGGIEVISSKSQISPIIFNDHILISYSSGEILYLNAHTGAEVWRYNLSRSDEDVGIPSFDPSVIITRPVFLDNFAYFATSNGKIVKINTKDGQVAWIRVANDVQSMILHDNNLIITNNARQIAVLSTYDGKIHWVGNLISNKERNSKKPKAFWFLDPFVIKNAESYTINVVSSNNELYQFVSDAHGVFPKEPVISKIDTNIRYYWISCCSGTIHLISDKNVRF